MGRETLGDEIRWKGDGFGLKHWIIYYAAAYFFPHLTYNVCDNNENHYQSYCTSVLRQRPKALLNI